MKASLKTDDELAVEVVTEMRRRGARFTVIQSAGPAPQWLWEPERGRRHEIAFYWKWLDIKPSDAAMVRAIIRSATAAA